MEKMERYMIQAGGVQLHFTKMDIVITEDTSIGQKFVR